MDSNTHWATEEEAESHALENSSVRGMRDSTVQVAAEQPVEPQQQFF